MQEGLGTPFDQLVGTSTDPLSPRQREIAELLVEGITLAEIAKRLNLSRTTVGSHADKLYKVLGVTNQMAALVELIKQDLVKPSWLRSFKKGPS